MSYNAPPPPGGYGAPQPAYGGAPMEHPQGTTILILGILSIVCCGIFTGIPAIIMGRKASNDGQAYSNAGVIKAGYICGIIGTVLSVLGIVFYIIMFAIAGSVSLSTS
ncbi:hypothetical protein HNR19_001711 [Nocardioides thalensis]|uniref:DUF4190 domain-containing protein n=1 Tax=Nocardioides thalensis TaxID=1914755 RepID=A0A853C3Y1_9ACTN|nr:DUF4190 domain-containing protein [Nocardioides thalensis]NYJ01013.1 hypothetical protein [Nocardioides thalensis]